MMMMMIFGGRGAIIFPHEIGEIPFTKTVFGWIVSLVLITDFKELGRVVTV